MSTRVKQDEVSESLQLVHDTLSTLRVYCVLTSDLSTRPKLRNIDFRALLAKETQVLTAQATRHPW